MAAPLKVDRNVEPEWSPRNASSSITKAAEKVELVAAYYFPKNHPHRAELFAIVDRLREIRNENEPGWNKS